MSRGALFLVILVCIIAAGLVVMLRRAPLLGVGVVGGALVRRGAVRRRAETSPHLVVDTLNLTHHLLKSKQIDGDVPLGCSVLDAIDFSAARLRAGRSGRIMFVVKDRDSRAREAVSDAAARKDALAADALSHALFQACARRSGAHIYVVENYRPAPGEKAGLGQEGARKTQHEAAGRDDFYAGVLAWQHRCPVLTADRMRDFADLRHHVAPFIVWEFAPHRARPEKNFVNPAAVAYRAVRAPVRVAFADAGL